MAVELGMAFATNGTTPDYGGLASLIASLKDSVVAELRADMSSAIIDQLVRKLGTLTVTAPDVKVNVAPPTTHVAAPNVTVTAPDVDLADVTVNVSGLESLPAQLRTIEALLRELISVSRAPVKTTVSRDPNNLIQTTTQTKV